MPKGKLGWFRGRGTNESGSTDEARIIAVVDEANTSFAEGRFEQTCDCYSEAVQRQVAAQVGAPDCMQAWTTIHAHLKSSLTPEQFIALTSRSIASVELKGTTAVARYPALPPSLRSVPGLRDAMTIRMRKIDGDWEIDSLPSG